MVGVSRLCSTVGGASRSRTRRHLPTACRGCRVHRSVVLDWAARSRPAQNARPAPVSTMQRTSGSWSASSRRREMADEHRPGDRVHPLRGVEGDRRHVVGDLVAHLVDERIASSARHPTRTYRPGGAARASADGRSSPASVDSTSHTVIAHSAVAPATCRPTSSGGHVAEVLHVPDRRLQEGDEDPRRQRPLQRRSLVGVALHAHGDGDGDGDGGQDARAVHPRRVGDVDVEAPHVLVPGVRPGPGHDRAGDDRRAGRHGAAPTRGRRVVVDTAARRRSPSGSPARRTRHDGVGDEHQRQQHVALDGQRVQVDEHRDPAEHDLSERPRRRARRTAR